MSVDIYINKFSGPSRAVLMILKYLNIEHNVKNVDLSEGEQLKPEYIKMNPAHTVPTIDDNGFVLWESRAIMQYLCNQYAPDSSLYPKDPKKRAVVDRWLNFDMTLIISQGAVLFSKMISGADPPEDKVSAYKNNLKLVDQLIGDNKYLTGNELTIADVSLLVAVYYADLCGYDLSDYPNFKRWSSLKSELPYYQDISSSDLEEIAILVEKMKAKLAQQK